MDAKQLEAEAQRIVLEEFQSIAALDRRCDVRVVHVTADDRRLRNYGKPVEFNHTDLREGTYRRTLRLLGRAAGTTLKKLINAARRECASVTPIAILFERGCPPVRAEVVQFDSTPPLAIIMVVMRCVLAEKAELCRRQHQANESILVCSRCAGKQEPASLGLVLESGCAGTCQVCGLEFSDFKNVTTYRLLGEDQGGGEQGTGDDAARQIFG